MKLISFLEYEFYIQSGPIKFKSNLIKETNGKILNIVKHRNMKT